MQPGHRVGSAKRLIALLPALEVKAPIDTLGLSDGARSGLTGFIAGLARQPQLAGKNVTVNNLLPGPFDTERLRKNISLAADKKGVSVEK